MKKTSLALTIAFILSPLLLAGCTSNTSTGIDSPESVPTGLDSFAQCLKDKGAVFYGTFWCQHCTNQKKLFGSSVKYLSYIECSTKDGQGQTKECQDKKITGYPTWEFADGSRQSGELSLERLSEKTGCVLPSQQKL